MRDRLEDRIHQDGKHDEFSAAVNKFRESDHNRTDELELYDKLVELGADPEEADEFVNMEVENAE
jgi:hypothetical protein